MLFSNLQTISVKLRSKDLNSLYLNRLRFVEAVCYYGFVLQLKNLGLRNHLVTMSGVGVIYLCFIVFP